MNKLISIMHKNLFASHSLYIFLGFFFVSTITPQFASADDPHTIDEWHDSGSSDLFALTDDIDSFFGDVRSDEHKQNDWFRLGGEFKVRVGSKARFRERLRASLDLSEASKNLRFFINGDNGDRNNQTTILDDTTDSNDYTVNYRGDSAATGLSYDFYKSEKQILSADAGLKFRSGPHPFGEIRGGRWFDLGSSFSFEPTQYLQWIEADGFGEKTRLDLNYALNETERIRNRTEGLRTESSQGVELLDDLSWIKKFTDKTYIGTAVTITAYTLPSWTPDLYEFSVRYRQLTYGDWLYLELEPAIDFPQDRDYKLSPAMTIRVDAYFDRTSSKRHDELQKTLNNTQINAKNR